VEKAGKGVVSFISNYAWLDGLSYTGMRERYLDAFDAIDIDCMNGDKYKTGKLTPQGDPDPSVFSTEFNKEGIQVGTAIATLVKKSGAHQADAAVRFRHFWGKNKRAELLQASESTYETVLPVLALGLPLMPTTGTEDYLTWSSLVDLFPTYFPGVQTKQDALLTDINRDNLEKRMRLYFDSNIDNAEIARLVPGAMDGTNASEPKSTRDYLTKRGFLPQYIVPYAFRPFDKRWLYWEPETKLLGRKVPEYFPHVRSDNVWIVTQQKPRRDWSQPQFIRYLGCLDLMDRSASCFPLFLYKDHNSLLEQAGRSSNIAAGAVAYLSAIQANTEDIFYHLLSVLHAPLYRSTNASALTQDWPRIPLPKKKDVLKLSAGLGFQVAALLDTESPVPNVTTGKIRDDLKTIAVFERTDGKQANPASGDLDLTVGWGHAGKGGITMPGKGLVLESGNALDIYLNENTRWRNVPKAVWEYTIGGYQVIKKWLSYREKNLLGRGLTPDEVRYVTEMARRIAVLIALQPALDENYRKVIKSTYPWPRS
jgi:hypothetical protein